ncbi:aspartokinase [hydrocarbon metagenome]|uniref:aspartate kinase n=1 Tax=hydrocarbon metagenome TaxID=938273 RepID=A0A0W8E5D0_9ZZZZ
MKIAVQKYGGTSLATPELRSRVCDIIADTINDGYSVVVVVSAIGRLNDPYATDTFISLIKQVNTNPSPRELDLIMSCGEMISGLILSNHLSARGIASTFLTGEQSGLVTDGNYGNAHILYVNPRKVMQCLEAGLVPVVAGFQGISENGELTTLGRGGSDTTASALGVALNADYIDIFTDVDGIMTADPRIVEDARLINDITYNEICQMAREGAKVVHPRAIEIAMQRGIPLRVRSTFSNSPGTLVRNRIDSESNVVSIIRDMLITGITYTSNIAQIKIDTAKIKEPRGIQLKIFKAMADAGISVDFINVQPELIMFTVADEQAEPAELILKNIDVSPIIEFNCAKVAVVGAAMTGIPGVMARVVEALDQYDIPILQSGDSYTNIWCLVKKDDMKLAVKALHDQFELGKK